MTKISKPIYTSGLFQFCFCFFLRDLEYQHSTNSEFVFCFDPHSGQFAFYGIEQELWLLLEKQKQWSLFKMSFSDYPLEMARISVCQVTHRILQTKENKTK